MRESAGKLSLLNPMLIYAGSSETTVQDVEGATVSVCAWSKDATKIKGRGTRMLQQATIMIGKLIDQPVTSSC